MRAMPIARGFGWLLTIGGLLMSSSVVASLEGDPDKAGLIATLLMGIAGFIAGIGFLRGAVIVDRDGVTLRQVCFDRRFDWADVLGADIADEPGLFPRTKIVISRRGRKPKSLWPTLRYVTSRSRAESAALVEEIRRFAGG
jgi:hypothetical protein